MKKINHLIYLALTLIVMGCSKNEELQAPAGPAPLTGLNVSSNFVLGSDPLAPYLNSVPTVLSTISTTISGSITIKEFTFSSKGGVNTVYGYLAYPTAAGVYPAVMFNHGGGGNALTQANTVRYYATLGYVTLSIDIPAIAAVSLAPNSSGPWKSGPTGDAPIFNVTGGAQNSTLCDGIVACLEGFNYLKSLPNVNPNAMGVSGSSWGGYMSTIMAGLLGSKVKAVYSVYGCGYYDAGSQWKATISAMSQPDQTTWLSYYDAGRRAPGMTAPYFVEAPSNDTFFWPEAVDNTLNAIPGTKNHVTMANRNHKSFPESALMRQTFIDYYLKGTGKPFGSISLASALPQGDGSLQVNLTTSVPAGVSVSAVRLYYSIPTANWQSRQWDSIPAMNVSGNNYQAVLSASLVAQHPNYYASVIDNRTVTTSTAMQPGLLPPFRSGTYKIVNRASGLVLDVRARLTANGSVVQQHNYGSATNQQWQVTSLGGGQYKIIGVQSGRSLDAAGQQTTDGTAIDIFDYTGTTSQKWIIAPVGGGLYSIKGVASGKLVEVVGSSTTAGALIDLRTNDNGNGQKWTFAAP